MSRPPDNYFENAIVKDELRMGLERNASYGIGTESFAKLWLAE